MRPDKQEKMRIALERGPAFVPDDLFAGSRAAQMRALKAYANTISHARYVALEETFPQTREHMGYEAFHAVSERHLADADALSRPLRKIGAGFSALLEDPAAADLADAEWAMLEAHGAPDAPAITMETIKGQTPEGLIAARVQCHPATKIVALRNPERFALEQVGTSDGDMLLVTRPAIDVQVARVTNREAALLASAACTVTLGELLESDAEAVTPLLEHGALRPQLELL